MADALTLLTVTVPFAEHDAAVVVNVGVATALIVTNTVLVDVQVLGAVAVAV